MDSTILIVDDEEPIRNALSLLLSDNYEVLTAPSGEDALAQLQTTVVDLVLLDIGLPDISGLKLLETLKKEMPRIMVIMITAVEDTKSIVDAIKLGAHDYLVKPVSSQNLKLTIKNSLEHGQLKRHIDLLKKSHDMGQNDILIGTHQAMQQVSRMIEKVSTSLETPILIDGQTGVGKGVIARAIHNKSSNHDEPFVIVNCGAISKELVESELFGYAKGAFTGARSGGKTGRFEEAGGGTLFLDEIGIMPLEAQAKLLSVLEERSFYRVGGSRKIRVRGRILAATNLDLEDAVSRGNFRQDLFFRLNLITITTPPLQDRPDDIIPLAEHFLQLNNVKFHKHFTNISFEARIALLSHPWPGNIRELRNTMERIALLEDGNTVLPAHLPFSTLDSKEQVQNIPVINNKRSYIDYESLTSNLIREGLKECKGNVSKTAIFLNMPAHKLRYRIRKLGLTI